VGDPADRALKWFWGRGGNICMPKPALGHVAKPTPEEAVVERENAERTLQKKIPQVHEKSRPNTNGNGSYYSVCLDVHDLSQFTRSA
jgi:hypothetical protein